MDRYAITLNTTRTLVRDTTTNQVIATYGTSRSAIKAARDVARVLNHGRPPRHAHVPTPLSRCAIALMARLNPGEHPAILEARQPSA